MGVDMLRCWIIRSACSIHHRSLPHLVKVVCLVGVSGSLLPVVAMQQCCMSPAGYLPAQVGDGLANTDGYQC
jgi:hypothetical protein